MSDNCQINVLSEKAVFSYEDMESFHYIGCQKKGIANQLGIASVYFFVDYLF